MNYGTLLLVSLAILSWIWLIFSLIKFMEEDSNEIKWVVNFSIALVIAISSLSILLSIIDWSILSDPIMEWSNTEIYLKNEVPE